jgi:hypothetical protein
LKFQKLFLATGLALSLSSCSAENSNTLKESTTQSAWRNSKEVQFKDWCVSENLKNCNAAIPSDSFLNDTTWRLLFDLLGESFATPSVINLGQTAMQSNEMQNFLKLLAGDTWVPYVGSLKSASLQNESKSFHVKASSFFAEFEGVQLELPGSLEVQYDSGSLRTKNVSFVTPNGNKETIEKISASSAFRIDLQTDKHLIKALPVTFFAGYSKPVQGQPENNLANLVFFKAFSELLNSRQPELVEGFKLLVPEANIRTIESRLKSHFSNEIPLQKMGLFLLKRLQSVEAGLSQKNRLFAVRFVSPSVCEINLVNVPAVGKLKIDFATESEIVVGPIQTKSNGSGSVKLSGLSGKVGLVQAGVDSIEIDDKGNAALAVGRIARIPLTSGASQPGNGAKPVEIASVECR